MSSSVLVNARFALPNLMRAAACSEAAGVSELRDTHRIRSYVDLRSTAEQSGHGPVAAAFQSEGAFLAVNSFTDALFGAAPLWLQLLVALLVLFGCRDWAATLFVRGFLNRIGVRGLTLLIAQRATAQLRAVMLHLCDAQHLPCLVSCAQGKDRTGIVVALLQLLVGWPREQIVQDYLLSERGLDPIRDKLLRVDYRKFGLDPSYSHATRDAIEALLDFIKADGGVDAYFERRLRLSPTEIAQLRANFGPNAAKLSETHFI